MVLKFTADVSWRVPSSPSHATSALIVSYLFTVIVLIMKLMIFIDKGNNLNLQLADAIISCSVYFYGSRYNVAGRWSRRQRVLLV